MLNHYLESLKSLYTNDKMLERVHSLAELLFLFIVCSLFIPMTGITLILTCMLCYAITVLYIGFMFDQEEQSVDSDKRFTVITIKAHLWFGLVVIGLTLVTVILWYIMG